MLKAAALLVGIPLWALAQDGATVQGTVTNSVTHAGLSGVEVTLWTQRAVRFNATTDDTGAWKITGVPPDRYYSRFEKSGFLEAPKEGPISDTPLMIGAGGMPVQLDRELVPLATVSGRVLDPEGKPAAGVEVGFSAFNTATTNSDGEFVLRDQRPGSYTLLAKPKAAGEAPPSGPRSEVVPTYYPSADSRPQAVPIAIRGGDVLSGFEIRLRAAPVYRVRGVVLDETGKPVADASVRLLAPNQERALGGQMTIGGASPMRYFFAMSPLETDEVPPVVSGRDGAFEFSSVPRGEWKLRAETEPKRDADRNLSLAWSEELDVAVNDRDLDDLRLRLPPTFTLQATVDWGNRPPPADTTGRTAMSLLLISVEGSGPSMPRPVSAKPGAITRFGNVAAGRYRIVPMPGSPAGYYPAAVMLEGQDVLGRPVDLNAATPALRIVYKPNPGTVRGTVEKGEGATVLLWQQSAGIPDMMRAVQAGANGSFEIANVPPGDYAVLAVDKQNLQKQPEAVLRGFAANATAVHVDEAGSPSVSLPLTHLME